MKATVFIDEVRVDDWHYGVPGEHLNGSVIFNMEVDGRAFVAQSAPFKLTIGATFTTSGFEVSNPAGYKGPFNHLAFSAGVEKYFRSTVGPSGRLFQWADDATNIRISGGGGFALEPGAPEATITFVVRPDGGNW